MVIHVHQKNGPKLFIPLPTGLIFNGITAGIAARATPKTDTPMNAAQLRRLFAAVRHYKQKHPDWVLVDVRSADGDRVKITL